MKYLMTLICSLFLVSTIFAGPDEDLFLAIKNKDLKKVNKALKSGANPKAFNAEGFSPLHELFYGININMYENEIAIFNTLIKAGAQVDIEARNKNRASVLEAAVSSGSVQAMNLSFEAGATVTKGFPLHTACFKRCARCSVLLVEKGADVNKRNLLGQTPVMLLLEYTGNDEVISGMLKFLHGQGASLKVQNTKGESLLDMAQRNKLTRAADFLKQNGVRNNFQPQASAPSSQAPNEIFVKTSMSRTYESDYPDAFIRFELSNGQKITLYDKNGAYVAILQVIKSVYLDPNKPYEAYFSVASNSEGISHMVLLEVPDLNVYRNGYLVSPTGLNRLVIFFTDGNHLVLDASF